MLNRLPPPRSDDLFADGPADTPLAQAATAARRYQPDELIIAGCGWARARSIPNHQFSVLRVGDHAHVINCMFDMATLTATVSREQGHYARVTATTECARCESR